MWTTLCTGKIFRLTPGNARFVVLTHAMTVPISRPEYWISFQYAKPDRALRDLPVLRGLPVQVHSDPLGCGLRLRAAGATASAARLHLPSVRAGAWGGLISGLGSSSGPRSRCTAFRIASVGGRDLPLSHSVKVSSETPKYVAREVPPSLHPALLRIRCESERICLASFLFTARGFCQHGCREKSQENPCPLPYITGYFFLRLAFFFGLVALNWWSLCGVDSMRRSTSSAVGRLNSLMRGVCAHA